MIQVPLSYKELFPNNPHGSKEDLLREIPSELMLIMLSSINHQIFLDKTDLEILNFIGRNWPENLKRYILFFAKKLAIKSNSDISLFSSWLVTESIKLELQNFRDFKYSKRDTTPDDEFKMFLAYLKDIDEIIDKQKTPELQKIKKGEGHESWFAEVNWPLLLPQYEFEYTQDPLIELLKGNLLLTELKKVLKEEKYVDNYLATYGFDSPWEFISSFYNIIRESAIKSKNDIPIVKIRANSPYRFLIESKCIDVSEYQKNIDLQQRYKGIRSKPLLQIDNDIFLVLNWDFFISQIHLGILFDFYRKSGVKEKFSQFPSFKSVVSKEISEEKLFRTIIKHFFDKKHVVISFEEFEGSPDAYVREGKYIYIFEFKDVLFPDNQIEKGTYQDIKKVVDSKFISNEKGKPKGIKQLINVIQTLSKNCFEFDPYTTKRLKQKNVVIFPIIVYENLQFSLPGVNNYLNEKFVEMLGETSFLKVYPLTMISLDFLFKNIARYNQYKFSDGLKEYHKKIKSNLKQLNKKPALERILSAFSAIEYVTFPTARKEIKRSSTDQKAILSFLEDMNISDL